MVVYGSLIHLYLDFHAPELKRVGALVHEMSHTAHVRLVDDSYQFGGGYNPGGPLAKVSFPEPLHL
jgi:hypothetical protein